MAVCVRSFRFDFGWMWFLPFLFLMYVVNFYTLRYAHSHSFSALNNSLAPCGVPSADAAASLKNISCFHALDSNTLHPPRGRATEAVFVSTVWALGIGLASRFRGDS